MSNRKRYRVRYDRIVVVILVIAVIAVIASSVIIAVTRSDVPTAENTNSEADSAVTTVPSIVDNLETTAPPPTTEFQTTAPPASVPETSSAETSQPASESIFGEGFIGEMHSNGEIFTGDLVLVNTNHAYTFPLGDTELVTLFDHINTEYYSVSDYVIKLDANTVEHLNQMMTDFYRKY